VIGADEQREISTRLTLDPATVEIWSRPRFSADEWNLHARGCISKAPPCAAAPDITEVTVAHADPASIYRKATISDIDYGPTFALLQTLRRQGEEIVETTLSVPTPARAPIPARRCCIPPASTPPSTACSISSPRATRTPRPGCRSVSNA
jgi:hypothetical protein